MRDRCWYLVDRTGKPPPSLGTVENGSRLRRERLRRAEIRDLEPVSALNLDKTGIRKVHIHVVLSSEFRNCCHTKKRPHGGFGWPARLASWLGGLTLVVVGRTLRGPTFLPRELAPFGGGVTVLYIDAGCARNFFQSADIYSYFVARKQKRTAQRSTSHKTYGPCNEQ